MMTLYLWLALTVAGVVRAWLNLREIHTELVAARTLGDEPTQVVARGNRFAEHVRAAGYVTAVALAVVAISEHSARTLIDEGLVVFLALFVANTYGTAYYKRKLDEANAAASTPKGEAA